MSSNNSETVHYHETQHPTQWWAWMLVIGIPVFVFASFAYMLTTEAELGLSNSGNTLWDWLFVIVITVPVPVIFSLSKLVIQVKDTGIQYRYYPFHFRWQNVPYSEIESAEARHYRPFAEYGGWGIRYRRFSNKDRAFNVSGSEGVLLTLKSGKTILLGSQHMNDLEAVIRMRMVAGASE